MTAPLELRELQIADERVALQAHRELADDGFEFLLGWSPDVRWRDYLDGLSRTAAGIDLPPDRVAAAFLVADVDGVIVGRTSIRFALTPFLAQWGGHIGYGVRPGFRRRGYAIEILRQSLAVARAHGIATALVTCDEDNLGSAAVIERCGGEAGGHRRRSPRRDGQAPLLGAGVIIESVPDAAQMRDHWWWRPGWAVGSRQLAWHLTFEGQSALHRLAHRVQSGLADYPTLDPVPTPWLHLTLTSIGPAADVGEDDVASIIRRVRTRMAGRPPLRLACPRILLLAESVCLVPEPTDDLAALRADVADDVRSVLPDGPRGSHAFLPHVSLAYANGPQDGLGVIEALHGLAVQPVVDVSATLSLIEIHRDSRRYEWRTLAALPT